MLVVAGVAAVVMGPAGAADLERKIYPLVREPAYQTKAPRYALLVLGPEARTRVWLVLDGTTLYVDRNGNGDLTEPGKKVVGKKHGDVVLAEEACTFEIGELHDGTLRHLNVSLMVINLKTAIEPLRASAEAKALAARDPNPCSYRLSMEVEMPGQRGIGAGGRVVQLAGSSDLDGLLQFAERPQDAPVLHFGGPWTISLETSPTLRINREIDLRLVVGTPGRGKGSFTWVGYEGVVPPGVFPKAEITFPPQKPGAPPLRAIYELKHRC
jgi:hypothetical protein